MRGYTSCATDSVPYYGSVQKVSRTMFKLSKKADYGLIAVKHLAMHRKQHACSASEIAEEYGISSTLMAKVLQKLAHRSLVAAKHGSSGGDQLAKTPAQINALFFISPIPSPVPIPTSPSHHHDFHPPPT